jgi:heptosyltransferase II
MKALIIRFSSAGDIILTAGVINALKAANGKNTVHLLVKKGFEKAAALAGADKTVPVSFDRGLNRIIAGLNRENYEVVLDLQDNFRSRYISFFLKTPVKRVFKKDAIKRRLMAAFKWFMGYRKRVEDKYLETLKGIVPGFRLRHQPSLKLRLTSGFGGQAGFRVPSSNIRNPKSAIRNRTIVMHIGAKWPLKRWPYFAELAQMLVKSRGVKVVLTGAKDEVEKNNKVLYIKGPGIKNEIGRTSFGKLARIIKSAGLFIGNDTAAAHLAGFYRVPAVIFLGPTVQEFGFVTGRDFTVIEKKMMCRPCHLHGGNSCPIGTFECMRGISAGHAAEVVKRTLKN